MNTKEIFKKIGVIISELHDQHTYLTENPDSLNEFELELLKANTHFLNDHIEILQKLSLAGKPAAPATPPTVQDDAPKEEIPASREWVFHPSESVAEEEPEAEKEAPLTAMVEEAPQASAEEPEVEIAAPKEDSHEETPEPEEPVTRHFLDAEPIADEEEEDLEEEEELEEEPEQEQEEETEAEEEAEETETPIEAPEQESPEEEQPEKAPEPEPAADVRPPVHQAPETPQPVVNEVVISERTIAIDVPPPAPETKVPTLNDVLSAGMQHPPVTRSGQYSQPVTDIKSSISLNDKLLFVRDLFGGYSLAYSEAVDLANRAGSFEAAIKFLEASYAAKNQWDTKKASVDKFYEVVKKRYS